MVRGIHNDRLGEYVQEIFIIKILKENDLGLAISFSCFLGLKAQQLLYISVSGVVRKLDRANELVDVAIDGERQVLLSIENTVACVQ